MVSYNNSDVFTGDNGQEYSGYYNVVLQSITLVDHNLVVLYAPEYRDIRRWFCLGELRLLLDNEYQKRPRWKKSSSTKWVRLLHVCLNASGFMSLYTYF